MSGTSTEYDLQISFKTQRGTLINVPCGSPDQAKAKLEAVRGLAQEISATEETIVGAANAGGVVAGGPPPQQAQTPPPPPPPPPSDDPWAAAGAAPAQPGWGPPAAAGCPKTCQHGPYVFKQDVSKNGSNAGRAYKGWFCPGPGRTDCKPEGFAWA